MERLSLKQILAIGTIAIGATLYPSPSSEKIFISPKLIQNEYILKRDVKASKEHLEKRIINERLNTGEFSPRKVVELLEKGEKEGGGLPKYIDLPFLYTLVEAESEWNPLAKSEKGAKGLAQITEDTWEDYNLQTPYKEAYNPEANLETAVKIIRGHEEYFSKNHSRWNYLKKEEKLKIHAAAYNWGKSKLKKIKWNLNNKRKIPKETRNHIKKIMKTYEKIHKEKT